ncbi:coiled-coil and C2 domain-containing protein 1B isoform X1, partial [Tachysurus ichikawai]
MRDVTELLFLLQSFDAALMALERGEIVDLSKLPPPLSG